MSFPFVGGWELALLGGAFLLSLVFCGLVRCLAPALGLVDEPRQDRHHVRPISLGGGVAWMLALLTLMALGLWWMTSQTLPEALEIHRSGMEMKAVALSWILLGAVVLMLLGLFDDFRPVPVAFKIVVELGVGVMLAFMVPDIMITAFVDNLLLNQIMTIAWLFVWINAFNLLDHADGISTVTAIMVFLGLVALSFFDGQLFVGMFSLVLSGVLLGFLWHNFPPAKLFMGDAGTLPLGYFVGVLTALFTFYEEHKEWTALFVPLSLLLVPLYDTASVIWIRLRERRPIWLGDKKHFSHRMMKRGWSPRRVVCLMALVTAISAALACWQLTVRWPDSLWPLGGVLLLLIALQRLESSLMRLLPELIRFLTAFMIVLMFYAFISDNSHDSFLETPVNLVCVMLPFTGLLVWGLSLKTGTHVPVPGFLPAFLVILMVGVSCAMQAFEPLPLRSALVALMPCLLVPVLFQGMSSNPDRRALKALLLGLLVITLIQVGVEITVTNPSLETIADRHLDILAKDMGVNLDDEAAKSDLVNRVHTRSFLGISIPYGHFITRNLLAIALLLLATLARSMGHNRIALVTFLVTIFICLSKGVLLMALLAWPFFRHPRRIRWVIGAMMVVSFILWQHEFNLFLQRALQHLEASTGWAVSKSVSFRLSYWLTAHNMSDFYGPVGLGMYENYSAAARVDGGHFSLLPHNGFLKLISEIGLVAAVAAYFWMSQLFGSETVTKEPIKRPRTSVFWGGLSGLFLVIFGPTVSDGNIRASGTRFILDYTVHDGHIEPGHIGLVFWFRVCLMIVFALVFFGSLKKEWRLRSPALTLGLLTLMLHSFIEMDFSKWSVLTLFFCLASVNYVRRIAPSRWTWHTFPVLCFLVLIGIQWTQLDFHRDPHHIASQVRKVESKEERLKLLWQWHYLNPVDARPLFMLLDEISEDERVLVVKKIRDCEPANPSLMLDLARRCQERGDSQDRVRHLLLKAKRLDSIQTLDRYRLSPEERQELKRRLEPLEKPETN